MSDEMTKPILYSFRRCPYAMRARMSLLESGVEVELREVILRDRPEHMMEISPKGTVPVLLLSDGTVIEESLDIMLWSLDESWLAGDWKELIDVNDGDFKHHLDRYKYNNRYENVLSSEEHREHALSILKTYDERLSNQAYLCGDSISLADLALSPFVRQFANTDRGWFDQLPLLHLHDWLIGILEGDLFKSCMVKHKQWQNGQVPIYLS
ncbi:MAG: glutathione S-transferase [Euryarchaeota archaeon]|jgi:glutathione S-transferase|nr:glutathione S-transferase [Euryarchaeota archaeon]